MLNFLNEISDFNTEALDGDIVKLSGINRALVFQGLKVIARTKNLGFAALIEELELFEEINSYHLGYVIGPHINAGGRISNSSLGSTLLSKTNYCLCRLFCINPI